MILHLFYIFYIFFSIRKYNFRVLISCLAPLSYKIYYTIDKIQEIDLWQVYYMAMPRQRQESEKNTKR